MAQLILTIGDNKPLTIEEDSIHGSGVKLPDSIIDLPVELNKIYDSISDYIPSGIWKIVFKSGDGITINLSYLSSILFKA